MATLIKQNTAEGGTNATTVTTGNSGSTSGDAFDAVSIGASNALIFTSTSPLRGSLSYKFTKASVNQNFVGWTWTGAQADFGFSFSFQFPAANLSVTETVLRLFSGAGYTPQVASVLLQAGTGRKINVTDTVSAANTDSSASLALGGLYTVVGRWISGTSLAVTVYTYGTTTVVATASVASTAASVNSLRFGMTSSSNPATDLVFDDIQISYGGVPDRLDYANIAPTVDAGPDQNVAASATVNLSATGTDTDGTIASYAWTYDYPTSGAPTLTGGTTATPSFTAGAVGSLYVLRCTVTDNTGLTGFDTIEVRVPRAGSAVTRTLPITASTGTWTNVGGVATVGGALADESDSTYLETPTLTTTATVEKIRLDPSYARATGNLVLRLGTDTGTATATVRLVEGTTVRQTWTQAVTSTPTNYTFALTTTAINATSDWGRLFAEVSVVTP